MHKYHAKPTTVNGIRFASKRESERYQDLKLLQIAGEIDDLELQPRWDLHVKGVKVCRYVADFGYQQDGAFVVEDVKGVRLPLFKLKAKMLKAEYGITVLET